MNSHEDDEQEIHQLELQCLSKQVCSKTGSGGQQACRVLFRGVHRSSDGYS